MKIIKMAMIFALISTSAMASASTSDYVMLKVNGESIKKSEVMKVWKNIFPAKNSPNFENFDPKMRDSILRGIVSERILFKKALAEGLDKNAKILADVKDFKNRLIAQSLLERISKNPVSDIELQAEYKKIVQKFKGKEEIKAAHILVKDEKTAKEIAKKAKKEDFATLAKEFSTDKGSAVKGGDLGFFTKEKMVPEFANAAFALKEGEISAPIKTDFGWHIIKLEKRRSLKAPPFEKVKKKLTSKIKTLRMEEYMKNLLMNAKISYFDAKGKILPFENIPKELLKKNNINVESSK